jgi:hypothetical protein
MSLEFYDKISEWHELQIRASDGGSKFTPAMMRAYHRQK